MPSAPRAGRVLVALALAGLAAVAIAASALAGVAPGPWPQ